MIDVKEEPPLSAESARALLLHLMRRDSEDSHAAGWVVGNEFRLWCQVVRDPVVAGELREAVLHLPFRELASAAGGWWVWPEESAAQAPEFVSMTEWLPMYEARRQQLIQEYGPDGWAAGIAATREERSAFLEELLGRDSAGAPAEVSEEPQRSRTSEDGTVAPEAMSRETAAARLVRLMVEESEDNWGTSWAPDLEYSLWRSVVGDEPAGRPSWASDSARLKDFAANAKGWFIWKKGVEDVEFVPMDRWLLMYGEYSAAKGCAPAEGGLAGLSGTRPPGRDSSAATAASLALPENLPTETVGTMMTLIFDGVDTFTPQGPLPRAFRDGEIVKVVVVDVIHSDKGEAEGGDDGSQRKSGG